MKTSDRPGTHLYLLALGSNMRVPGIGGPRAVLQRALNYLEGHGTEIIGRSPLVDSNPVGPSLRHYANAAVVVRSEREPPAMLALAQETERAFGRKRRGLAWRARTLDIDLVLWSGGIWNDATLQIPHPLFRERGFVLGPAAAIAPLWRDPVTGLSLAQLDARLTRPRPLPR